MSCFKFVLVKLMMYVFYATGNNSQSSLVDHFKGTDNFQETFLFVKLIQESPTEINFK